MAFPRFSPCEYQKIINIADHIIAEKKNSLGVGKKDLNIDTAQFNKAY